MKPHLEVLEDRCCPSTLDVGVGEQYKSISAALTAAKPGDTIKVDPGVYNETLVITKSNITLEGSNENSIISTSPSTPASQSLALVEVSGAKNVTITGFTITGPGNGSGSIGVGVLVDNGGSANICDDHVTNIRDNPISGEQNGVAILVGTSFIAGTGTGSANINNDTIDNYQKGGIVVAGVGSSANITSNTVEGSPNNTAIPSNGIEIGHGATGTVRGNTVTGNEYVGVVGDGESPFEGSLPLSYQGVGILLYKAGKVTVQDNTVVANDIGIWDFSGASGTQILNNTASDSTFDGIVLEETGTAKTQVQSNTADANGHDGIEFIFDSTGSESGAPDTLHNHNVTLQTNTANNNGNDGVQVESGSTGNTFTKNKFVGNVVYDAQDASTGSKTDHTGNTWTGNSGKTSSPVGLVH